MKNKKAMIGDYTSSILLWIIFLVLAIGAVYLLIKRLKG